MKSNGYKKVGWLGISLCAICCALPLIGAIAGIGSITVIALYLEKIGMVVIGIAGIIFLYSKFKPVNNSKSCDVNCDCSGTPIKSNL